MDGEGHALVNIRVNPRSDDPDSGEIAALTTKEGYTWFNTTSKQFKVLDSAGNVLVLPLFSGPVISWEKVSTAEGLFAVFKEDGVEVGRVILT